MAANSPRSEAHVAKSGTANQYEPRARCNDDERGRYSGEGRRRGLESLALVTGFFRILPCVWFVQSTVPRRRGFLGTAARPHRVRPSALPGTRETARHFADPQSPCSQVLVYSLLQLRDGVPRSH
ncbi:unnamed protein product [Rangifer tarandus platyrhynchus]|uniref:Uncharacterized protein n=1 Tax=Rangifer tarandus platyrhynchus TaxID=3082113 RepID=A0ABN8XMB9_RANTA|nr:unnamed protein product [Rangifer tarandus platyrhynchus]